MTHHLHRVSHALFAVALGCSEGADSGAAATSAAASAGSAGAAQAGAGAGGGSGAAGGSTGGAAGGAGAAGADTSLVDARDGTKYPTVKLGAQHWMAKNLAFASPMGSTCYDEDPARCAADGRLYTWEVAGTVCPHGWHLPSDAEWKTLESTLGMSDSQLDVSGYATARGTDEGTKLKVGGTSGFDAVLPGFRTGATYEANGDRCYFWTSSTAPGNQVWRRRVVGTDAGIYRFPNPPASFAITIRCVED